MIRYGDLGMSVADGQDPAWDSLERDHRESLATLHEARQRLAVQDPLVRAALAFVAAIQSGGILAVMRVFPELERSAQSLLKEGGAG